MEVKPIKSSPLSLPSILLVRKIEDLLSLLLPSSTAVANSDRELFKLANGVRAFLRPLMEVLPQMKIFHDTLKIAAEDSSTKKRKQRDGIQHIDIQLIPEDIIMDILSRLPIHSLFQCTLVSKAWRDMIVHNPIFATMQHNRALENQNNTLLMFSHVNSPEVNLYLVEREVAGHRKLRVMDAKLTDHTCFNDRPEILGSCNGLLCISFYRRHRVYISNPITGECKKLPSKERSCDALVLGIGFDSTRKEYKVVRRVREKPFLQKIEIHTLGTNSWREMVNFPWSDRIVFLNNFSDVLVNGSLHWCSSHRKTLHITSLDMTDEQFGAVPTLELTSHGDIHLMAWKGFLTMSQQLLVDHSIHVWVMKEYNVKESWTKQINVTMPTWLFSGVNYWPFDDDTLVDDIRDLDNPRLRADSRTFCGLGVIAHMGSLVSLRKYRGRGKVGRMKFLPIQ